MKGSYSRDGGKGEHSGNMPVQLQMKVLVTQRKFDDTQRHMTVVKTKMEMMQKGLSREAIQHLQELEELEQQHAEQDADLEDEHAERAEQKAAMLAELEGAQQALFEQQQQGSDNLHQIDMAAEGCSACGGEKGRNGSSNPCHGSDAAVAGGSGGGQPTVRSRSCRNICVRVCARISQSWRSP